MVGTGSRLFFALAAIGLLGAVAFGLASTTRSIGWAAGPIAAGEVSLLGLRAVFGFSALGFLGLALLFGVALRVRARKGTSIA